MKKFYFSDGDKEQVTKILVMAEYGASTWDYEMSAFCMSDLDAPEELIMMIQKWEDDYISIPKYPGDNYGNEKNIDKFIADGLKISKLIKEFVGESVKVTYSDLMGNSIEISI